MQSARVSEATEVESTVGSVAIGAGDIHVPIIPKQEKLSKAKRKRSLAATSNEDTASETTSQSVSNLLA